MVLRYEYMLRVLPIVLSSVLVMSSAASTAAEGYHPDEFLNLDLSKAALSPKQLGPANTFGSVPAKERIDSDVAGAHAHAKAPHPARTEHVSAKKPRGTARTKLAHRHRNPLDAQAKTGMAMIRPNQMWTL